MLNIHKILTLYVFCCSFTLITIIYYLFSQIWCRSFMENFQLWVLVQALVAIESMEDTTLCLGLGIPRDTSFSFWSCLGNMAAFWTQGVKRGSGGCLNTYFYTATATPPSPLLILAWLTSFLLNCPRVHWLNLYSGIKESILQIWEKWKEVNNPWNPCQDVYLFPSQMIFRGCLTNNVKTDSRKNIQDK